MTLRISAFKQQLLQKKEEYCLDQFMRTKVLDFDEVQTHPEWKCVEECNVSLMMMGLWHLKKAIRTFLLHF